jgi:hypothetical protein
VPQPAGALFSLTLTLNTSCLTQPTGAMTIFSTKSNRLLRQILYLLLRHNFDRFQLIHLLANDPSVMKMTMTTLKPQICPAKTPSVALCARVALLVCLYYSCELKLYTQARWLTSESATRRTANETSRISSTTTPTRSVKLLQVTTRSWLSEYQPHLVRVTLTTGVLQDLP